VHNVPLLHSSLAVLFFRQPRTCVGCMLAIVLKSRSSLLMNLQCGADK
jgi:hypothetical protein